VQAGLPLSVYIPGRCSAQDGTAHGVGTYFFRLARIRRAFDQVLSSSPEVSTGPLLPADLLIDVMKALGQNPTVTEVSEVLSAPPNTYDN
jgi:hypothetical protein